MRITDIARGLRMDKPSQLSDDAATRDTADIAGDAGLIESGIHDAHARRTDADPRRRHADVAGGPRLVDAGIADPDSGRADARRDPGTGRTDSRRHSGAGCTDSRPHAGPGRADTSAWIDCNGRLHHGESRDHQTRMRASGL